MGALHPQVVHFTIVLTIVGVVFRLVSLVGKPAFASPAATTLLLLAAAASVVSVRSGTAAHGPVERAPGARPAVMEHEEWGERTQTALLIVGAIEVLGLLLRRSPKVRLVRSVAAVAGLAAVVCVYEAGEHGGELVYGYAGGVRKMWSGCCWLATTNRHWRSEAPDAALRRRSCSQRPLHAFQPILKCRCSQRIRCSATERIPKERSTPSQR